MTMTSMYRVGRVQLWRRKVIGLPGEAPCAWSSARCQCALGEALAWAALVLGLGCGWAQDGRLRVFDVIGEQSGFGRVVVG